MTNQDRLYHPAQADEYVNHLARLEHKNEAVAAEDIYNDSGILLLRKGTPIRQRTAASLYRHRLQQTLDSAVTVSRCKSRDDLLHDIQALLARYPDLQQIHKRHDFDDRLRQLFLLKNLPHTLLQKLTVLAENLPEVYERTLFCAWLTPLVALRMKLRHSSVYNVFIAALGHDLGLLHIPVETVQKRQGLDTAEWRAIQSHVVVGRLILERLNTYDQEVLLAVQNHHEHADGTGYPSAKREKQLDSLSQILALCDVLYDMRMRQFEAAGKNLANALPFLRVNNRTFGFTTYMAVVAILRRSRLQPSQESVVAPQQLQQDGRNIQQLQTLLHTLYEDVQQLPNNRYSQALTSLYEHAHTNLRSSGLGSEQLEQWLESLTVEETAEVMAELQEMKELSDEAHWVFKRAHRLIPPLATETGKAGETELDRIHHEMGTVLERWALAGDAE